MNKLSDASSQTTVSGAFEVFDGVTEHLDTVTRSGHVPQVGDKLAPIPGIDTKPEVCIIHTVNALETPTCDRCVDVLETLIAANPGIPVFTLTKQDLSKLSAETQTKIGSLGQKVVRIDDDTAIDLGVALRPGKDADPEFWPTALRRGVLVVKAGTITHVQLPDDQEEMPDFTAAFAAAR